MPAKNPGTRQSGFALPLSGPTERVRPNPGSLRRQSRLREALDLIATHGDYDDLWPHQKAAIQHLIGRFADPIILPNAVVVIPPSGGKTRIFSHILKAHGAVPAQKARPAILLAPTRNLVRYNLAELRDFGIDARFGWPRERRGSVHVMTYDRFQRAVGRKQMRADDVDLIVLNEAHRGLSDLRRGELGGFTYACPILAFSGTPSYDANKTLRGMLGEASEVYRIGSTELRNAGILAPIVNYVIEVAIDGTPPKDADRRELVINNALRAAVIEFYRTYEDPQHPLVLREKPYIGFHTTCENAQLATDIFNTLRAQNEMPSRTLMGQDKWAIHKDAIDGLREGRLKGLNNAKILEEGPNFANVGVVLNFAPTTSLVREIQRCGRAMAKNPDLPWDGPEQISAVVDTYVRINGQIQGKPRFYFEAVGDESIARIVTGATRSWTNIDPYGLYGTGWGEGGGSPGPKPPKPDPDPAASKKSKRSPRMREMASPAYEVSSRLADVHYLLEDRDRYTLWRTPAEILEAMPECDPARAKLVFDTVENYLDQHPPGVPYAIPVESCLLTAGRNLRHDDKGTVYDSSGIHLLAQLLDQPRTGFALGEQWKSVESLIGSTADAATKARTLRFIDDVLSMRRRGQSGLRESQGRTFLPPIIAKYVLVRKTPRVVIERNDWNRVKDLLTQAPI